VLAAPLKSTADRFPLAFTVPLKSRLPFTVVCAPHAAAPIITNIAVFIRSPRILAGTLKLA